MAAGHLYVRNNSSDTSIVPNAGTNLDASWDSLVYDQGSIGAYTSPNIQLDIGIYLITYSEHFTTLDTTTNERIEIQGEIHTVQSGLVGGYGQDYIRKISGQQSCHVSGSTILEITVDNTDVFTRFYRTDNSTTGTVNRVVGEGSINILELDSTHAFGFYDGTTTQTTSGTVGQQITLNTTIKEDVGLSRAGNSVTLVNTGQYVVSYSIPIDETGTGRNGLRAWVTKNTSTVATGSYSFCYMRGADSCQEGALSWVGVVNAIAGDTLELNFSSPSGTAGRANPSRNTNLRIWRLPANDMLLAESTAGTFNTGGSFTWGTLPILDTASFTGTAGQAGYDVDNVDFIFAFSNLSKQAAGGTTRAYPEISFVKNGVTISHMRGGAYNRNNASTEFIATNVAGIFDTTPGDTIQVQSLIGAASGSLNQSSGQFAMISLTSVFGAVYSPPPGISSFNITNGFLWGGINKVISGSSFEAIQGTGKVEFWSDPIGTTKVLQSIDSWTDTSIQVDPVQGALPDNVSIYLVVTTDGGKATTPFRVTVGSPPYKNVIADLASDHLWVLDNDYLDTGSTGPIRDMTNAVVGTHGFVSAPIAKDTAFCLQFDSLDDRREILDSPNMNITVVASERTICSWIELGGIQKSMSAIWKEGGGIQNMAALIGIGNVLLVQMADTPGLPGNVQAVSDFRLTANRPYHIAMRYSFLETIPEFRLYIDGEEQTVTDGNPLGAGTFNSHSGDVVWGDSDNSLETGGTDILYQGQESCKYSYFASWSDNSSNKGALNKTEEIRDLLFRLGALPKYTITSDTQSNMQIALDALGTIEVEDFPLGIEVQNVVGGGDLTLTATGLTFNDKTSAHVSWLGDGILTWIVGAGSAIDIDKSFSSTGGSIVAQSTVALKVTVRDIDDNSVIEGARVYLKTDAGGDLSEGVVLISGVTDINGSIESVLAFTNNQPASGRVRLAGVTKYKTGSILTNITSTGIDLEILLIRDE